MIWIWMENKSYDQIIGNFADAPYENQLASRCGLASSYTAVTHPSLPNYIAATSGDTWGISDDKGPLSHPLSVPSLYGVLSAAGMDWRDYEESAPAACPLTSTGLYAVKHDPATYYLGVRGDCARWDVPMGTVDAGAFRADLDSGSLPAFSFVTPDLRNDTHDCPISTGDAWLRSWVPEILESPNYQAGDTAIFLTWDEDDNSANNHIAMIVISPSTPEGTTSTTAFSHYSLLKTTQQMLGASPELAHAGDAETLSMRPAFGL